MTDRIARELKHAAADLEDVSQPELDALVERAARRQTRRRQVGALGVGVVVAVAGAVVWMTVGQSDSAPVAPATKPQATTFQVPTNSWRSGKAAMAARLVATLRFTSDGCPYAEIKGLSARPLWLAFPADAIGVTTADGTRHVANPDGYLYGTEGKQLDAGGGEMWAKNIKNTCGHFDGNVYGWGVQGGLTDERLDVIPSKLPPR